MSGEVWGALYDTPVWWPSNDQLRAEREARERRRERLELSRKRADKRKATT